MKRTVTINVTETHIKNGTRLECSRCPIALATAEALDLDPRMITAAPGTLAIYDSTAQTAGEVEVADMPEEATKFIFAFDAGKPVEPFSFTVTFNAVESRQ